MKLLASFALVYNTNLGENYENQLRVLDPGVRVCVCVVCGVWCVVCVCSVCVCVCVVCGVCVCVVCGVCV